MNIVLDNLVFALQKSGGISVVWYELLSRLMKTDNKLFLMNYKNNNLFTKKLCFNDNNVICDKNINFLTLKRYLNPRINIQEPFIFHSSYYRTCSNPYAINITTVHDFTYEYFASGIKRWIHLWQKYRAIRKSDYIICISENTKKDLLKFLPDVDENKIRVIYNGVSDDYYKKNETFKLNIPFEPMKYVLFVGARSKHKNFELSVKAVADTNLNLVMVGPPLSEEEIHFLNKIMKNTNRYYCTGRIDNCELNNLYNCAYALLYPSKYEGFGIPVIEAQKAGCPVIAYNGSSVAEIIGETPLLLQKLTTNEVVKSLQILSDTTVRESVIVRGLYNSRRFSWDNMYEQTIKLYNEAWLNKVVCL